MKVTSMKKSWAWLALGLLALLAPTAFAKDADTESSDSKDSKNYGTVIGIDLGTTYSCVGGTNMSYFKSFT